MVGNLAERERASWQDIHDLVSGYMSTFPKSGAAQIAQVAIELAAASKSSLASGNPRPHV